MGNLQGNESYTAVYANTVRYASVRALLAIGAARDYELFNVDIKAAYQRSTTIACTRSGVQTARSSSWASSWTTS